MNERIKLWLQFLITLLFFYAFIFSVILITNVYSNAEAFYPLYSMTGM